ncbi:hypothetical protein GCAAIG_00295 [Candidatus Electronema halotolerans]|jgi:hypothetical protein
MMRQGNQVRNNDEYRSLTKLLAKIGQEAGTSFCISLIPGLAGLLAAALNSVLGTFGFLLKFRSESAELVTNLLGGGTGFLSRKELRRIKLELVRCAKRNKEYGKALALVCGILETDAECAEALLLKAMILHEGFNDSAGARLSLRKLMRLRPDADNDLLRRWGAALHDELCLQQKRGQDNSSDQVRIRYE